MEKYVFKYAITLFNVNNERIKNCPKHKFNIKIKQDFFA